MDGKSLDLYGSSFFMDEVWKNTVSSVPCKVMAHQAHCKVMAHQAHGAQTAGVPWSTEQNLPLSGQYSLNRLIKNSLGK